MAGASHFKEVRRRGEGGGEYGIVTGAESMLLLYQNGVGTNNTGMCLALQSWLAIPQYAITEEHMHSLSM